MNALLTEIVKWVQSQTKEIDPDTPGVADDAATVRRVLNGPDGAAFLLFVAKLTVLRPATDPSLDGPASHDFAQRRTGENNIFAALVRYRDLADNLERKPDHDRSSRPGPGGLALAGARDPADERFTGSEFDPRGEIAGR